MSHGKAVITITSTDDTVHVVIDFEPVALRPGAINPRSHDLAVIALNAMLNECKGTEEHEIKLN